MRLLHAETKKLVEFYDKAIPSYAILSHTWGTDELTYRDVIASGHVPANKKIGGCCQQALEDGLEYVWIDTICIDKSSSSELSEAINSMFAWYRSSQICYAYLSDVSSDCNLNTSVAELAKPDSEFCRSKWFTRGWTLQELIAPGIVVFLNTHWQPIAKKYIILDDPRERDFQLLLESITKVSVDVLGRRMKPSQVSVAARMTWAAKRQTTRREDLAYCLMGIFGINMTLLYGEGERAFTRLQEEIIRTSDDESIFAWGFGRDPSHNRHQSRLMAASPADFEGCENIQLLSPNEQLKHLKGHSTHYSLTNKGLLIERPLLVLPYPFNTALVALNCSISAGSPQIIALPLRGDASEDTQLQVNPSGRPLLVDASFFDHKKLTRTRLYIDTSIRYVTRDLPRLFVRIREHSRQPKGNFRITEVHTTWFILSRVLNWNSTFIISSMNGRCGGQKNNMHILFRVECPNGRSYLLHSVHSGIPRGLESTWTAGVMHLEQDDSVVQHIFSTTAAGGFSAESGVAWPRLSGDSYLRLVLDGPRPCSHYPWILTIHCGEQEQIAVE